MIRERTTTPAGLGTPGSRVIANPGLGVIREGTIAMGGPPGPRRDEGQA